MSRARKYTRDLLQEAVDRSDSVAGVLRYLGINQAGGTHAHIARTIRAFAIDTGHFHRSQGGRKRATRKTPRQIFVVLDPGSRRANPTQLRRALMEIGRPYRCEGCGQDGTWQDQPLVLHVDHIDGDYCNNASGNLRFLCPNCHSQTADYAGRGRGKYSRL